MKHYSQIGQDLIVLKYLKNKKNGVFVDIGCGYPKYINNTFLLEEDYNWSGLSIDLHDCVESDGIKWDGIRNTKRLLTDALTVNYSKLFKDENLPKVIDYLSMDLEPPSLTMDCLYKIPFDEYTFNVVTFEIDKGRDNDVERITNSRDYFKSKGYILLGSLCGGQDDVYIHNSLSHLETELSFYDESINWTTWK